jgi:hypothetical protein
MGFSAAERALLLKAYQVGPKVVQRLEQIGVDSFHRLKGQDPVMLSVMIGDDLGASCWKHNPMAVTALTNAIITAQTGIPGQKGRP